MSDPKTVLRQLQKTLLADLAQGNSAAATVDLDQNKVGRLSRMDALAQQEMQKAGQVLLRKRLVNVDKALAAVAQGDYGFCDQCGDEIALQRLEVMPESVLCVRCAGLGEQ